MDSYEDKKLHLLAYVERKQHVTFADVDRVIGDSDYTQDHPGFLLYKEPDSDELLWVFVKGELMQMIRELLDTEALDIIDTTTISYVRNKPTTTTAKKFMYLMKMKNWVPTALVKGKHFDKEMERLNNDTSRKTKTTSSKQ